MRGKASDTPRPSGDERAKGKLPWPGAAAQSGTEAKSRRPDFFEKFDAIFSILTTI